MQTLHHAWAPKLGRTIVLNSTGQLRLWAMLEAHPEVTRYRERPAWPGDVHPVWTPDFWALRDGTPVWLVLDDDAQGCDEPAPPPDGPALQTVTAHDLDSHDIWIRNWLSLLPYLSTFASLERADVGVSQTMVEFFGREASFEEAEHHFAHLDPMLVRAYHGVMHQRAGASRCLCHRVSLEEHCRGCGADAEYRLTARLLGAPFRCANCRRPYAGWRATFVPRPAHPDLRRAITRTRFNA